LAIYSSPFYLRISLQPLVYLCLCSCRQFSGWGSLETREPRLRNSARGCWSH